MFSALAQPDRQIFAFDVSPVLQQQAQAWADALCQPSKPVSVSLQRLESFVYQQQFDLILLPYYNFGNLLSADLRRQCLQRISQHLKREGRAVIHLPATELLTGTVSPKEITAMHSRQIVRTSSHGNLVLELNVEGMYYLAAYDLRSLQVMAKCC